MGEVSRAVIFIQNLSSVILKYNTKGEDYDGWKLTTIFFRRIGLFVRLVGLKGRRVDTKIRARPQLYFNGFHRTTLEAVDETRDLILVVCRL